MSETATKYPNAGPGCDLGRYRTGEVPQAGDVIEGHSDRIQGAIFMPAFPLKERDTLTVTEVSEQFVGLNGCLPLHFAARFDLLSRATPSAPAEQHECSAECIAELEQAVSDAESRANERGREIQRLADRVRQLEGGIRVFVNKTRVGKGMEVHVSLDDFNALSTILFAEPNILKPAAPQPASADAGETERVRSPGDPLSPEQLEFISQRTKAAEDGSSDAAVAPVIRGPGKYRTKRYDETLDLKWLVTLFDWNDAVSNGWHSGRCANGITSSWRITDGRQPEYLPDDYLITGPYVEPPKPPVLTITDERHERGWVYAWTKFERAKFPEVKGISPTSNPEDVGEMVRMGHLYVHEDGPLVVIESDWPRVQELVAKVNAEAAKG